MPETGNNEAAMRRGRILLAVLVAAALGVLAAAVASCNKTVRVPPAGAPHEEPAPLIRVKLTARPVRSVWLSTWGGYRVKVSGRTVAADSAALSPTAIRRSEGHWQFRDTTWPGGDLVLEPSGEGWVGLGRKRYRGRLHLIPQRSSSFFAVNHVDVESYLAGVLAKELYPNWHPQAYRALAIAARTFALYHAATAAHSRPFDLGAGQEAQVYGGYLAETPKAWQATRSTRGVVLAFGPPGQERIFLTQYSASCGGRVNPASALRNAKDIPPLQGGQQCEDCRNCPYYRWPDVVVSKANAYQALAASHPAARRLGSLEELRVTSRTDSNRPVWLALIGPGGPSVRLRAETVRLALLRRASTGARGLRSMNCRIHSRGDTITFTDGRGFGHGVGLCQWGAQGKAVKGWTGERILGFYYPGAKRFRVY